MLLYVYTGNNTMTIGICKYCGQECELIKSHIIPKALYQIDKLGGVVGINSKERKLDRNPEHQNGIKMPLLCKNCDNLRGKLDGYANRVLNGAVPKIKTYHSVDNSKCIRLPADQYDIPRIRTFFISLLWRFSVIDTRPFPLGKYSDIALKILKGEMPDDERLFLPLIYKRATGGHVDNFVAAYRIRYMNKWAYDIRFPGYEVIIIVNTENSCDKQMMEMHKKLFNKNEILIVEINRPTPVDYQLVNTLMISRGPKPPNK